MKNLELIFFIFLIVFVSDDTIMFGTNNNETYIIAKYVLYIFMLGYVLFFKNPENVDKTKNSVNYVIPILMLLSFIGTLISNAELRNGYFLQLIVVILAGSIAIRIELRSFLIHYSRLLFYIASFSLLLFTLSVVARPLIDLLPVLENYEQVEFLNAGLAVVFRDPDIVRNVGVFREPGVFAIYLLIGLMVELFYDERPNVNRVLVFSMALVTTVSTAGYLIAFIILSGYIFRQSAIKAILLLASAAALFYVFYDPILSVFSKFDQGSTQYSSALARISSASVPFYIFLNYPVFGSGLTNFFDEYFLVSQQLYGIPIDPSNSSTNTILNTFAIYGFLFGCLTVIGILRFSIQISKNILIISITFISLVMIYSSQELRFSLFFNCLIMLGLLTPARRQVK